MPNYKDENGKWMNTKKTKEEKERVVDLLATGRTVTEVVKLTGITKQTIYYWKRNHNLDDEINLKRNEYVGQAVSRIIPNMPQVVDSLVEMALNGETSNIKLQASKYIMQYITEFSNTQSKAKLNINVKADATTAANIAKNNGFNLDELLENPTIDAEFTVKDDEENDE